MNFHPCRMPTTRWTRTSPQGRSASTTASITPTYVTNLNGLIEGTERRASASKRSSLRPSRAGCSTTPRRCGTTPSTGTRWRPSGGGDPSGDLAGRSTRRSVRRRLQATVRRQGQGQFGSGWAWLIKDGDGLAILNTDDADTPLKHGKTPLLTVDVWEHAYYIDYRNARPAYLETFVDKLLNWEFAAANFSA